MYGTRTWHALAVTALVAAIGLTLGAAPADAQAPNKMIPRGEYVRQAYNEEATLIIGYRTANLSVGNEWMLLEAGFTVLPGNNQQIKRDQFMLETPDGTMIPMATQTEAQAETATLKALNRRADIQMEPINYFPKQVQIATPMSFFANPAEPGELPFDEFGASAEQGRMGRLFFKVPGGIQYGEYLLHLKLAKGKLVVPINIMTKEELKAAKKAYKEFEKQQRALAKEQKKQGN
jgi:hypothetical protein